MTSQAAVIQSVPAERKRHRKLLGGAGVLTAATLGSGLLAYAFLVLTARALGAEAYGQIAVLWGALFLVTIVLFRPLEQTLSRAFADRIARQEGVRSVLRTVLALFAGIVLVGGVAFIVAWQPLTDRLFLGNNVLTAMLALGIVGYGVCYLARGIFGGARWFEGYGLVLMADAVARLLIALPLVVLASVDLAAAALALATLAGAAIPLWAGRRVLGRVFTPSNGPRFELGSALRFAAPASLIAGSDQLLVNGAPVLVMLEGGQGASKAAGVVFAATMLVRVPVYMFQGLAASLLPNITHMQAADQVAEIRRGVTRTSAVLLGTGLVIVAFTAAIGPEAMRLLFGGDFEAGRTSLTLLGAGVGCYLAAATITQALLALDWGARAAAAWVASALLFVAVYTAIPGSALGRVSTAFAVATLVALLALALTLAGRLARR